VVRGGKFGRGGKKKEVAIEQPGGLKHRSLNPENDCFVSLEGRGQMAQG